MIHKLLFAGDLHKRNKDISTIKGYVKCVDAVQESIINIIQKEGITHFIHLGDWYDRGYIDDITAAIADTSMEEYMNKILKGNFYGVIGNHIRLRLDSNPELMLIQPHTSIVSRKPVKRTEPIIKTPSCFTIGNVQISLIHFDSTIQHVNDYEVVRLPNVVYHIACVHDAKFIPNSRLRSIQYPPTTSLDSQIAQKLKDVDLCICGDIHIPIGMFELSPNTKMIIPGSLTNTTASEKTRHSSINMPLITIDDETDKVSIAFYPINLKINMLTFDSKKNDTISDKIKSLRGNNVKNLYEDKDFESVLTTGIASMSFGSFLTQQGYTKGDKDLIRSMLSKPEDIVNLMKIRYNDINIPELK